MGADNFMNHVLARNAAEAFSKAVESAAWEHGHGGYTGTIAEKHSFVMARGKPEGMTADEYVAKIEALWYDEAQSCAWAEREDWKVWDDKWGPALCLATGRSRVVNGDTLLEFVFFGMASS